MARGKNFTYALRTISGKPSLDMPADGVRVCASSAMTNYDRMPRPVKPEQRTQPIYGFTPGYRHAVIELESIAEAVRRLKR